METSLEDNNAWDRMEMILINLFPKVWSSKLYHIVVNNTEIYSGDVQESGSLRSAIEKSSPVRGWYPR